MFFVMENHYNNSGLPIRFGFTFVCAPLIVEGVSFGVPPHMNLLIRFSVPHRHFGANFDNNFNV